MAIRRMQRSVLGDSRGAAAIEYSLLAGLIALGLAASLPNVRVALVATFEYISEALKQLKPLLKLLNTPGASADVIPGMNQAFFDGLHEMQLLVDGAGVIFRKYTSYDRNNHPWEAWADSNGQLWIDHGGGIFQNQTTGQTRTQADFAAMNSHGTALSTAAGNGVGYTLNPNNGSQLVDLRGQAYDVYQQSGSPGNHVLVKVGAAPPSYAGQKVEQLQSLMPHIDMSRL